MRRIVHETICVDYSSSYLEFFFLSSFGRLAEQHSEDILAEYKILYLAIREKNT